MNGKVPGEPCYGTVEFSRPIDVSGQSSLWQPWISNERRRSFSRVYLTGTSDLTLIECKLG